MQRQLSPSRVDCQASDNLIDTRVEIFVPGPLIIRKVYSSDVTTCLCLGRYFLFSSGVDGLVTKHGDRSVLIVRRVLILNRFRKSLPAKAFV